MPDSLPARILNFDDSLTGQKILLERFNPAVIDLRQLGEFARLWSGPETANRIRNSLDPKFRHSPTFLGSGDFHHISALLIEQFSEPISVIVFDYHPDWDTLPPRLGCGSWVSAILRRENVKKVVLLGSGSEDLSSFSIQTGNLNSLRNGRVEIYPYMHKPTPVWFRRIAEDNQSIQVSGGILGSKIIWRQLKDADLKGLFSEIFKRIETKQVYVSIDKDCLKSAYSLTNWEEGCMELEELLLALRLIKENLQIIGVDIVGDYSPPKTKGRLKTFFSRLDHPRDFSAKSRPESQICPVNSQANVKILELLIA
jgi:hypothetical protein